VAKIIQEVQCCFEMHPMGASFYVSFSDVVRAQGFRFEPRMLKSVERCSCTAATFAQEFLYCLNDNAGFVLGEDVKVLRAIEYPY
jgi:hypothetical protein